MIPTRKGPLFLVTGASCAGKSTLCEVLFQKEKGYVVLESDLLWQERYNTPEDGYAAYRNLWMRICANVGQVGLPVVLCGCALPEQFETREEREFFTQIHYLAVVCSGEELEKRMDKRGVTDAGWRESSRQFNRWLVENAASCQPGIALLDTTGLTPEEGAEQAHRWIVERLAGESGASLAV
ncbi:MAG: AAA family ATPase [Oscillospiraceae bacterium]|jgi:chloramphenicol 3-O-phosphotransferase|nr:AAA family ATPase [Oscillospiraceae bacterium]